MNVVDSVHEVVTYVQEPLHVNVPPLYGPPGIPGDVQVLPPKSVPSHCSIPSFTLLPH